MQLLARCVKLKHVYWPATFFRRAPYAKSHFGFCRARVFAAGWRMKARYLVGSLVLHGLLLSALFVEPASKRLPKAIEVVIVVAPKTKKLLPKVGQYKPRLGSTAYRRQYRRLGETMASDIYLERLKRHIEPHWHRFVSEARQTQNCTVVLNIDADFRGTVDAIVTVRSNCLLKLEQAAIKAVWYANLLPPPKSFLTKDGTLELEWTFTLSKKA